MGWELFGEAKHPYFEQKLQCLQMQKCFLPSREKRKITPFFSSPSSPARPKTGKAGRTVAYFHIK